MTDIVSTPPADGRRRILPPHSVRHDFLAPELVTQLLAFAQAHAGEFAPAKVGVNADLKVNPAIRISSRLRKFEPLQSQVENLLRPLGPELAAELRVKPFETTFMELELVAHGDGAFYKPHIDLVRGYEGPPLPGIRLISGVYYFHAQPKAFEGGALRLLELGGAEPPDRAFVDIEPVSNSLVFFPSWMPHEVRPVRCASGRFMDSRFAINCWFHGAKI